MIDLPDDPEYAISRSLDGAERHRSSIDRWVASNRITVDAYRRVDQQGLWNEDLRTLRGSI